ncbi:MAG: DUF933 domain-containing protein [Myxococcota bacterium]
MDVGIVGPPGSGRTTVFRALLAHRAPKAAGARASDAGIGTIRIQDPRLEALSERFHPRKTTPIEIRVHDLCGSLEPTFPRDEIEAMKRLDLILLVIPGFADPAPEAALAAYDALLEELCLEDLAGIDRRLRFADRDGLAPPLRRALERANVALEQAQPLVSALDPADREILRGSSLITDRGMLALLNVAESRAGAAVPKLLAERARQRGMPLGTLCAALEAEMAELAPDERAPFLAEYGVGEPAGARVTQMLLEVADVISFFTVGEDECRAWSLERGATARRAAGRIHSDLERGFIRAEVIGYEALAPLSGGLAEAKKRGLLRLEGKDYVVQDGDIVHVRFNV